MLRTLVTPVALATLLALSAAVPSVRAMDAAVMSEKDVRAALFGRTLEGEYADGKGWGERFEPDGRTRYTEEGRTVAGRISFRRGGGAPLVCFSYPDTFGGGCFEVWRRSLNCFDFYGADERGAFASPRQRRSGTGWTARAWDESRPSTCRSDLIG